MIFATVFFGLSVVGMIIFLVVVGFCLWLAGSHIEGNFRTIIIALIVFAVILWLLDAFGIFPLPAAFQIGGGK